MTKRFVGGVVGLVLAGVISACSDDANDPDAAAADATGSAAGGQGGAGGGGGAAIGGNGGAACDDSGPDPLNHTAGTCSNLGETALVAYCNEAIATLEPGVAYAAISCLANTCLRGAPCTAQEYQQQAEQCLVDALAQACPDEDANATCVELEALCNSTAGDCHTFADGLQDATLAEVLACAEADCSAGLAECVAQVLTP